MQWVAWAQVNADASSQLHLSMPQGTHKDSFLDYLGQNASLAWAHSASSQIHCSLDSSNMRIVVRLQLL